MGLIKYILKAAIIPPGSLLLLFTVAFVIRKRHPRWAKRLVFASVTLLYLVSTPLVSHGLNRLIESGVPVTSLAIEKFRPQAIVLLGGGGDNHSPEYGNAPFPSKSALARVSLTAYWAKRTDLPILVTGGAQCSHGHSEAEGMALALAPYDLRPKWMERESANTYLNAKLSRPLLEADGIKKILLVTSASHMSRAKRHFQKEGFEVLEAPVEFDDQTRGHFYSLVLIPTANDFSKSCSALRAIVAETKSRI